MNALGWEFLEVVGRRSGKHEESTEEGVHKRGSRGKNLHGMKLRS